MLQPEAERAAGGAPAAQTLDFSQPIAVMLIAILHVIGDDEDPYGIVAKLIDAVPPGSYLALSHVPSDMEPEKAAEAGNRLNQLMHQKVAFRTHAQVTRFFDGLDLVEPGVVRIPEWRPGTGATAQPRWTMWGGVGRKRWEERPAREQARRDDNQPPCLAVSPDSRCGNPVEVWIPRGGDQGERHLVVTGSQSDRTATACGPQKHFQISRRHRRVSVGTGLSGHNDHGQPVQPD